jgi:hypothetical protein
VDAFSNFYDFKELGETTSCEVIQQLKCWFALFGIQSKLCRDNGPQFSSRYFTQFSNDWQFEHCISSPYYPRSNELAERFVKEAKNCHFGTRKSYELNGVVACSG